MEAISRTTSPEKFSGVPAKRWQSSTFATFKTTKDNALAHARVSAVASGIAWCAVLGGPPGTGKTHLAIAAMHAYEDAGGSAYFWKVPDFLEWIRVLAYGQELGVFGVLKSYEEQPFLLVLDDLGVEKQTEWADEQLYRVLDARYENELPTIITTNQPLEKLDKRIMSRFSSGLVACKGQDYRRAG